MDKSTIAFITEITVIIFIVLSTLIQLIQKQIKKNKDKENKNENLNRIRLIHLGLEKTLDAIHTKKDHKFKQQIKQIKEKTDLLTNKLFLIFCESLNISVQDQKAKIYKETCLNKAKEKVIEILNKKAKDNNFERYSDDAWDRYVKGSVESIIEEAGQVQVACFDENIIGVSFDEASKKTAEKFLLHSEIALKDLFTILKDNADYYSEEIEKMKKLLDQTKDLQKEII